MTSAHRCWWFWTLLVLVSNIASMVKSLGITLTPKELVGQTSNRLRRRLFASLKPLLENHASMTSLLHYADYDFGFSYKRVLLDSAQLDFLLAHAGCLDLEVLLPMRGLELSPDNLDWLFANLDQLPGVAVELATPWHSRYSHKEQWLMLEHIVRYRLHRLQSYEYCNMVSNTALFILGTTWILFDKACSELTREPSVMATSVHVEIRRQAMQEGNLLAHVRAVCLFDHWPGLGGTAITEAENDDVDDGNSEDATITAEWGWETLGDELRSAFSVISKARSLHSSSGASPSFPPPSEPVLQAMTSVLQAILSSVEFPMEQRARSSLELLLTILPLGVLGLTEECSILHEFFANYPPSVVAPYQAKELFRQLYPKGEEYILVLLSSSWRRALQESPSTGHFPKRLLPFPTLLSLWRRRNWDFHRGIGVINHARRLVRESSGSRSESEYEYEDEDGDEDDGENEDEDEIEDEIKEEIRADKRENTRKEAKQKQEREILRTTLVPGSIRYTCSGSLRNPIQLYWIGKLAALIVYHEDLLQEHWSHLGRIQSLNLDLDAGYEGWNDEAKVLYLIDEFCIDPGQGPFPDSRLAKGLWEILEGIREILVDSRFEVLLMARERSLQ